MQLKRRKSVVQPEAHSYLVQMRRKGVGVDQIFDARALRVVVGDGDGKLHVAAVEGCYNLLSVVHRWTIAFIRRVLNFHHLCVTSQCCPP